MTTSERRTKIRRERVIEFYKQTVRNLIAARKDYISIATNPKSKQSEKDEAYNTYTRKLNESFMFRYGVSMADPYGKWMKKFEAAYDEIAKQEDEENDEKTITENV